MEVHAHKQFILNDAFYTLGNGVVFRVAAFGHADTYSVRPEFAGIGIAGILHASIRVVYDVIDSVLVKTPQCHVKCFDGKLRLQSVADTPADYQKGNTLIKDVGKGISLLNQIIEYDVLESDEKEIEEMRMKAKGLVRLIKESNEYGWIGRVFHRYLKSLHEETMPPDGYNHDVLSILDELTFNGILKIYFAQHVSIGDNSWFYIDTGHSTKALEKRLLIEKVGATCSEMSAWQIYLLTTASTVLPAFWHGNYENRQYVFSKSDISNLSGFCRGNIFSKVDISNIADDILPGVELIGNMAKVRCCYWNDWEGLVRETVSINFNDRKNIRINEEIESEVLYEYNCGIKY